MNEAVGLDWRSMQKKMEGRVRKFGPFGIIRNCCGRGAGLDESTAGDDGQEYEWKGVYGMTEQRMRPGMIEPLTSVELTHTMRA